MCYRRSFKCERFLKLKNNYRTKSSGNQGSPELFVLVLSSTSLRGGQTKLALPNKSMVLFPFNPMNWAAGTTNISGTRLRFQSCCHRWLPPTDNSLRCRANSLYYYMQYKATLLTSGTTRCLPSASEMRCQSPLAAQKFSWAALYVAEGLPVFSAI